MPNSSKIKNLSLINSYQLLTVTLEVPHVLPGQSLKTRQLELPVIGHKGDQLQVITSCQSNLNRLTEEQYQIVGNGITDQQIMDIEKSKGSVVITAKDQGVVSAIYLTQRIRELLGDGRTFAFIELVLIEVNQSIPLKLIPSQILLPNLSESIDASVAYFESLDIASRIACPKGKAGCYQGTLEELATKLNADEPSFKFG
ncbi:hypothetical protein [Aliikangiella sp. IMCC44632]